MKQHWFKEAFGAAASVVSDIIRESRETVLFDGWFGPKPDHTKSDLGWARDDQAKSDLGWTRDDQAKPEHSKDAQSPETSREQERGIDR